MPPGVAKSLWCWCDDWTAGAALDLTTPAGRAMAAMLAVFAAFEREVLQERARAGLAMPARTGNAWSGRQLPPSMPLTSGNCIGPG
jgi:hypothetical protein